MPSITSKSFIRQNIFSTSAEFIAFSVGVLFNIIFPLLLGAALFGELAIALGFAFLVGGIFQEGFNKAAVKNISKHLQKNDFSSINSYFRYILKLKAGFYLVLSISVFLLSEQIAGAYGIPGLGVLLQLSSVLIFIFCFTAYLRSVSIALRKAQYDLFSSVISNTLRIIAPVALFVLGFSLSGIMLGLLLAYAVPCILLIVLLKLKFGKMFKAKTKPIDKKKVKTDIFHLTSISASNSMMNWGILLILGFFAGSANAGFFRISLAWVLAIITFIPISSPVIFASFTGMMSKQKLKKYIEKILTYTAIIAIPASVGLYILGGKLVALIYGKEFFMAGISLGIISFAMFPIFVNRVLFSAIISLNKVKQTGIIFLTGTGAGLVMSVFLSDLFGLEGASFSFLFTVSLIALILWVYMRKHLDISGRKIIVKPVFASVIMGLVVYYLKPFAGSIFTGIGLIILGMIIYFALLYAVKGITRQDFELIKYLRR